MGLADRVTARVPTVTLAQLTQASPGSTTVDTTILGYAVADALGDFATYVGVEYDDTDDQHIGHAVRGVLIYLRLYKAETKADELLLGWHKSLEFGLRMRYGNNRILPTTRSPLRPTAETATEPYFGQEQRNRWIPSGNRGGSWPPSSEPGP